MKRRSSVKQIRRDLRFGDEGGIDCFSNEVIFEQVTLMIAKTTAWNEFSSTIASVPRHHGDTIAQTRSENVSNFSNDPPLSRVNTLRSREDRSKLKELMELCIKLSDRVLNLETTKTAQAKEIANVKKRVKRLERKRKSRSHGLKRLYKVGLSARVESSKKESLGKEDASKQGRKITDINVDEEPTLVDETTKEQRRLNAQDEIIFDVNADLYEVIEDITIVAIQETVSTAALINIVVTIDELTLAQALAELKSAKPRTDKVVIQEQELGTTTTTIAVTAASTRPKARSIVMQEPKPLKMKKKDQISCDEQKARRLQAEINEQDRLAKEEAKKELEANIAIIEQWHDVQAHIDVDYELAQRLQAKKEEQLTNAEKARLFMEFLEKIKKFFAAKRAEEKRDRPPTKAQQKSFMCTYLKIIDGWKIRALKNKSFAEIQELFDKAMKRVNMFVDMDTEVVESSSIDSLRK
uniref:Uncharacterized protein n=1 Tax=Tanacetum cinerariifolium TaxID=118510 RepID=A0A6L2KPP2_TANCI|nr:hypothetical protein [Tanacetum cinerariifolium]